MIFHSLFNVSAIEMYLRNRRVGNLVLTGGVCWQDEKMTCHLSLCSIRPAVN